MSILSTDIKFYLSGGAAQSDPDAALGGAKSSVAIVDDTVQNLFDNVLGSEHTAGDTEYRCLFVKNDSAEQATNVKIYIETNTPSGDTVITIGKDLTGQGDTADTIPDESTAPDPAVTFALAASYADALDLGTLEAGESYPIWVKRVVSAGTTPQTNDNAVLKVSVDSA